MALFQRRQPEVESAPPPAQARRAKPLAQADFEDARAAACAHLDSGGDVVRTLSALSDVLDDHVTDGVVSKLSPGPLAVTVAQLDSAIEEIGDSVGSHSMSILKRARSLLLASERATKEVDMSPVTREEFDATVDALISAIAAVAASRPDSGRIHDSARYHLDRAIKRAGTGRVAESLKRIAQALTAENQADSLEQARRDSNAGLG